MRYGASGDGGVLVVRHRLGVVGVSVPGRLEELREIEGRVNVALVDVLRPQMPVVQMLPVAVGMESHVQSHGERSEARGRPQGQREDRRQATRERMHGADYSRPKGSGQPRGPRISIPAPHRRHDLGPASQAMVDPPRWLRRAADAILLYPVLVVLFLYGEWLLAWSVLGHPPVPSWNDPKFIVGSSWMHGVTSLVLFGALPALSVSVVFYPIVGMFPRASPRRLAVRVLTVAASWGALFVLLRWDPGRVLEWWLD